MKWIKLQWSLVCNYKDSEPQEAQQHSIKIWSMSRKVILWLKGLQLKVSSLKKVIRRKTKIILKTHKLLISKLYPSLNYLFRRCIWQDLAELRLIQLAVSHLEEIHNFSNCMIWVVSKKAAITSLPGCCKLGGMNSAMTTTKNNSKCKKYNPLALCLKNSRSLQKELVS